MVEYKITENIPFYFRFAQAWYVFFNGIKGQWILYKILLRLGLLNKACKFKHFKEGMYIPLHNSGTLHVLNWTEIIAIREVNFANFIYRNLDNFTLIDCGASWGLISMRLASICDKLESIIAIEPNYSYHEILTQNLSLKKVDFKAIQSAVSDFSGNASLNFPNGDHDGQSAYITKDDNGSIKVVKVDDIVNDNIMDIATTDIALKIDVEGQEIPVIMGAINTIKNAKSICFFVEVHPEVLKRNNQNGEDILKAISNIRDTKWYIADNPQHVIDENKPFFSQVANIRQYDVIGVSTASR